MQAILNRVLAPLIIPAFAVVAPALASAQTATILSGRVLSEAGQPIAAVSVAIPALGVGAVSTDDGRYSFSVPARAQGQTLNVIARRIGYQAATIPVRISGSAVTQDFKLSTSVVQLQGQVITALGVARDKSQLGTAQQAVSHEQLTSGAPDPNILNQLSGKVAGVQITGSGTQGGSTKITIRGSSSIAGNNSPLYVIDGIPVQDRDRGSDANGGFDFGSTISDINPEDIESMSVLKGPNAAALYGSRAQNGVIIITTKHGRASDGKVSTDASTSLTFDTPSLLPKYQNQYGQGSGGKFSFVDGAGGGTNDGSDQSFGPKLDGRKINQFNGDSLPWVAHPNNVKDFFNTGKTLTTNLAFTGGTDRANARVSLGTQNVDGIVPNNTFRRINGLINGTLKVSDRLTADGSLNYVRNEARNRPGVGYNVSIMEQFIWFGRQVDMNALKNYYDANGQLYNWNYNFHNNPYFLQYENPENDNRDRVLGTGSLRYRVADWLDARVQTASDVARYGISQDFAAGNLNYADPSYNGAFSLLNQNTNENNTSALLTAHKSAFGHFAFNGTAGVNRRYETYDAVSQSTTGILGAGIYNVANSAVTPTLGQNMQRRQVNSAYGSAAFTFNDFWTVEGTARNDWSSTLPKGENSYFYPSVNTSLVLTNMFPSLKNSVLSYAKLRGSLAQVGNDASVYLTRSTFTGNPKYGGNPQFTLGDQLANAFLKPEQTKAAEAGFEATLFGDRASVDATYYGKSTTNQIIAQSISPASGFPSKSANAGEITNKGVELQLNVTPISLSNGFRWNSTVNWTQNRSHVVALADGLTSQVYGSTWTISTQARVGGPNGVIYGTPFLRDSATGELLLNKGLPQGDAAHQRVLGNIEPKWIGGWNNEIRFKGFQVSALLDWHQGGSIFSVSNMFGDNTGVLSNTLKGREVDWNNPGVTVHGIDQATGKENTKTVNAETYWQSMFEIGEQYTYDATFIKLREVRVGYDIPTRLLGRMNVSGANLSFVGRNLLTHTKVPNIDPELAYSTGNYQGAEFAALPNVRSIGLNLRITP